VLAAHLYEPPARPGELRPDLPESLQAVVLRCLAKNPAERFHGARSLERALAECPTTDLWTKEDAAVWWQAFPLRGQCRTGPQGGRPNWGCRCNDEYQAASS
jgi:hypothetical protein